MSLPRKTFSVAELVWKCNYFCARSKPEQIAERQATISLTSSILHDTGNYKGFGYLELMKIADGQLTIDDESRVVFYISDTLREEYKKIDDQKKADL